MNVARPGTPERSGIGAVFVVGMYASGVELLGGALSELGLTAPRGLRGTEDAEELTSFNDVLLRAAGDGKEGPPELSPVDLDRALAAYREQAQARIAAVLPDPWPQSWLLADPRLSVLAPFWETALPVNPAIVMVHRDPAAVAALAVPEIPQRELLMKWWDRCNRAALVLCSDHPSYVLSYEDLVARPKSVLSELSEYLGELGVLLDVDTGPAVHYIEAASSLPEATASIPVPVSHQHHTLDHLLREHDGRSTGAVAKDDRVIQATAEFYNEDYYGSSYDAQGVPYSRDEPIWVEFFGSLASSIVKELHPRTALDVGCAIGMLVEALRDRGVEAQGIDISPWAIGQVPERIRPFCRVGSVTDEIEGHYELITCIEVMEHLPPSLADQCVGNLCRHADMVLFSSTPDDFDEPTHLNVEPNSYWAQLFLRHGYVRDFDFDATFLAPHAVLFRRGDDRPAALVDGYERGWWHAANGLRSRLTRAVEEHRTIAQEYNRLGVDADTLRRERDDFRRDAIRYAEQYDNANRRRQAETVAAYEAVRRSELSQRELAALVVSRDAELTAIRNTKVFRYTAKLRRLYGGLRGRRLPVATPSSTHAPRPDGSYQTWIDLYDTLDDAARARLSARVSTLPEQPTISVIMPVYNPPVSLLAAAIESVQQQIYQKWELCIADDASTDPEVSKVLVQSAELDPRIKFVRREANGHISAASNSALELATGEWVTCLDHDDVLAEHALAMAALALGDHPDAAVVYSDEDKLDERGDRKDPFFKPDFDPLLLLGQNYVNHMTVLRRDLVSRVGGYREGYEGSQDWDLLLRVTELVEPEQVVHVPHVLYHWRVHPGSTASLVSAKPYAVDAGRLAVVDHLQRTGRPAQVMRAGPSGHNRVVWALPDVLPKVSIVIPTKDGRLLQRCIQSILALTQYPNFDLLIIDNSSSGFETLSFLQSTDDRVNVLRDERPFNFAALNNHAVDRTNGEILCLLNDDTEIISGEWLTEMVAQLLQPGVGAVGAKLDYEDGRVQHAGIIMGIGGVAGHANRMADRLSPGYFGNMHLAHLMSGVTAACVAIRREAWRSVEGFDEKNLPVAFNDVDLCLRLGEAGWSIVWTPYAELLHHESISRGPDTGPRAEAFAREVSYMELRWGFGGLRKDRFYNPNLSLDTEDYALAWPPRVSLDHAD